MALSILKKAAFASFGLSILKFFAFVSTGSLVVLASLLDSFADTLVSLSNDYIHRISREEPDSGHPFGHGGFEVLAALIQGLVILGFGANLCLESVRKIFSHDFKHVSENAIVFSLGIMLLSALGSLWIERLISKGIARVEQGQRSLALITDRTHYAGDFWMNALAAVGLLVVYLSGVEWVDLVFGLVGGVVLAGTSFPILRKSIKDVLHSEAPVYLQQKIFDLVMNTDPKIKGMHALRTREFGPHLYVDFHMKLDAAMKLHEAHRLGDRVEQRIRDKIPYSDVLIHIDPDTEQEEGFWQPSYDPTSKN